jgi:hypothetical protein
MTDKVKSYCNNCLSETDHIVEFDKIIRGSEQYSEGCSISWSDTYSLLECCGCHEIQLKKVSWFSEADPFDGADVYYYPPRVSRKKPNWVGYIPEEQRKLLDEIYTALHADSKSLAVMGTRALVDMFMNERLGDIGGFEQKLKALVDNGFISKRQKEILSIALDTGHAVIHRGFYPKIETVNQVLDIVESLLQNYSLEELSHELQEVTPKRNKK